MTVECHSPFSDPGATASDTCDAHPTVATNGLPIDVNTPGIYVLTYTAMDATGNTSSLTRTVTVSDSQPPVITLTNGASITMECHTTFTDPGFSAFDACEGVRPVTPSGTVDTNTPNDYTLTYTACDSGNHCSTLTRVVHVVDGTAPVVTANANAPINVECHGGFTDPGATVIDDCDARPTVVTNGLPDGNTVGTYTVTYTATDAGGNTGSATCVIIVADNTPPTITATNPNDRMPTAPSSISVRQLSTTAAVPLRTSLSPAALSTPILPVPTP